MHNPDPHDVQISDNLWRRARTLEKECYAALNAARSFDVRHDVPWPCDLPVPDGSGGWRPCGARGMCQHVD